MIGLGRLAIVSRSNSFVSSHIRTFVILGAEWIQNSMKLSYFWGSLSYKGRGAESLSCEAKEMVRLVLHLHMEKNPTLKKLSRFAHISQYSLKTEDPTLSLVSPAPGVWCLTV